VTLNEVSNLGASNIDVHRGTAPWSESTVTWNSFGSAYAAAVETSFSNGGGGHTGAVAFDVAPLVQAWTSGAVVNNGIVLNAASNSTWSSSEDPIAARRPSMNVCYLP
jgi:trimeric autotransporter adhesin